MQQNLKTKIKTSYKKHASIDNRERLEFNTISPILSTGDGAQLSILLQNSQPVSYAYDGSLFLKPLQLIVHATPAIANICCSQILYICSERQPTQEAGAMALQC